LLDVAGGGAYVDTATCQTKSRSQKINNKKIDFDSRMPMAKIYVKNRKKV